jgi:hypothetical protein
MKTATTFLFLLFATVSMAGNGRSRFETTFSSELITMRVQAHKVACDGFSADKMCFMVQKGASIGTDFWEVLPEPIDGFNFEEGYIYDLSIRITLRENPAENESKFIYELVKVVSKKKE